MDFRFSDDQLLFAETVRDILANECTPMAVREAWENESGTVPGLWQTLARTGIVGMTAPAESGGLGMAEIDLVLLMEELGRAACPELVLEHTAVAIPLLAEAPEPIAARWLGPAAAGEARVAVAIDSPFVLGADQAALLVLRSGDELHAVEAATASTARQRSVDETRRLFTVDWEPTAATFVTDDPLIVRQARHRGAVSAAAQCVGIAQRLLDLTVAYVQERRQFGKPVGVNQAVKHHLADTGKAIEFARPMVHRAAWTLAAESADAETAVPMAKLLASKAVDHACRTSLQCHGAIAYTVEYDLQLWMKRGWALAAAWGDANEHRDAIGAAIGI